MFVLGDLLNVVTFWKKEKRDAVRDLRESRQNTRNEEHFAADRRERSQNNTEKLRDNLKYRLSIEGDNTKNKVLERRLKATEVALTEILSDTALDDPRVRYYYAENMRAMVPREIGPQAQLPEPEQETAALVVEASDAAGATPADAEGHFLRGNALYLLSPRLEGESILKALTDAVEAYDKALEVYTRQALPQDLAVTLNNKGAALTRLGDRLDGEAGANALTDAVEAYDQALEVNTREALPQDWDMTLNNKGNALTRLGERMEGEAGAKALTDAVEAYDQALEVLTRQAFPQNWATTLNNKGNVLLSLGERLEGEAGAKPSPTPWRHTIGSWKFTLRTTTHFFIAALRRTGKRLAGCWSNKGDRRSRLDSGGCVYVASQQNTPLGRRWANAAEKAGRRIWSGPVSPSTGPVRANGTPTAIPRRFRRA